MRASLCILFGTFLLGCGSDDSNGGGPTSTGGSGGTSSGGTSSGGDAGTSSGGTAGTSTGGGGAAGLGGGFGGALSDYPGQAPQGMLVWGAAVQGNGDPGPPHEAPTGHPLGVRRTFFQWNQRTTGMLLSGTSKMAGSPLAGVVKSRLTRTCPTSTGALALAVKLDCVQASNT